MEEDEDREREKITARLKDNQQGWVSVWKVTKKSASAADLNTKETTNSSCYSHSRRLSRFKIRRKLSCPPFYPFPRIFQEEKSGIGLFVI